MPKTVQLSGRIEDSPTLACAWCDRVVAHRGPHTSHGICLECFPGEAGVPLVHYPDRTGQPALVLPFGEALVLIDGTVAAFACNGGCQPCIPDRRCPRPEGRHFFRDAIPLAVLAPIERWLQDRSPDAADTIAAADFVLERGGERFLVGVTCTHIPGDPAARLSLTATDEMGHPIRVRRDGSL